jgi:hypothetical protein
MILKASALAVIVTLLALAMHALSNENDGSPLGDFGRRDLVAFWSGVHAVSQGQSPYDQDALIAAQKLTASAGPRITHNPPWTLVLLYPILSAPFNAVVVLYFFLNVLLLLLSAGLAQEYFFVRVVPDSKISAEARGRAEAFTLLSIFCFIPSYMVLMIGQLTVFVLFFLLVSLTLMRGGREFLAGLAFVPVSMKPHLISLVIIGVFAKVLIERKFQFIAGFLLGLAILVFATELMRPGIYAEWVQSASDAHNQINSTLVAFVRQEIQEHYAIVPLWPVIAIPLVAMIVTAMWIACMARSFCLEKSLPYLLCLSLLFAPHAWLYDYVLLVCLFIPLFDLCRRDSLLPKYRYGVGGLLILLQVSIAVTAIFDTNGSSYFWFPALVLLVWHLVVKMRPEGRLVQFGV